jgi:putative ABC transport system permease protein
MSSTRRPPALLAAARSVVAIASLVVPFRYRRRFREEWCSELWHYRAEGASWSSCIGRTLGVFQDAIATRLLLDGAGAPELPHGRRAKGGKTNVLQESRLALRAVVKRPGLSLFLVLTLAVGIGANTAVFSLVEAVLLRPLRYPDSARLVKIQGLDTDSGTPGNLSPADFADLAAGSELFESMGAHGWVGFFTVSGNFEPERVSGSNVTGDFFGTLGVTPAAGRLLTAADDRKGAPSAAVITYGFWQTHFGGAPGVVGTTLRVNAEPAEIVGILPRDWSHPEPNPEREPVLYTPYQFDPSDLPRSGHFIRGVGRLRAGKTIDEARSELSAIARRLEETYPDSNTHRGVYLLPLKEAIVSGSRTGLLVLYGAVGVVLLIVCANLANLQLAHGFARRKALAMQSALGARRSAIVRQLLIESLSVSLAGGVLGFFLASAARGVFAERAIPRAGELDFDATVLGFSIVLSSSTAIVFGLLPALSLSSSSLTNVLLEGGGRGATSRAGARRLLVGVEVALSLLLLVAAGLFLKSLSELRSVSTGFHSERVLTLSMSLPTARYAEGEQIPFYDELYGRVAALPGVAAVGATNILPLTNNYSSDGFQIEDRPVPEGEAPSAEARSVSADYFAAMGIPLVRGRLFDARDRVGSPGVVVVSESMARKFWPDEDPLGKHVTYNRGIDGPGRRLVGGTGSREIVGVVGDVKHLGLGDEDVPTFYTPDAHQPSFHTRTLVVRSDLPADSLASSVSRELSAMDREIPLYGIRALNDVVEASVSPERFRTRLLGVFALVALALAAIGVYAVMGLAVVQRRHEIGIRIALGARARDVVSMLVGESLKPVAGGILAGGVAAIFVTRLMKSLLFKVSTSDPATYLAVASILGVAALAAALVPSLRAARVDPAVTLRED